jgi:hypothetical protein
MEIYGEENSEERAMFHQAKAGMTGGLSGSLDKLDEYLVNKEGPV